MTIRPAVLGFVAVISLGAALQAQTTTTSKEAVGTAGYSTSKMTGDVVTVDGTNLLVKMQPGGELRFFNVPPGRQFMIDGQNKLVGDLKPGTHLTAMVITKTQPLTVRTMSTISGTVWYVQGNYVILTLSNGQSREFNVPESYRFTVDGKPASVADLRKGMKVTGTKIVAESETDISTETVVTGTAPK
jgi:hypothetical protein